MTIIDRTQDGGSSSPSRERFIKRVKDQIKGSIQKSIDTRDIRDFTKKGTVSVPIKGLREPMLGHDPKLGKRDRILPGNDRFSPGEKHMKPPPKDGKGNQSGPEGDGSKGSFHRAHLFGHHCWIEKVSEKKEAKRNRGFHFNRDGFEIRRKDVIRREFWEITIRSLDTTDFRKIIKIF